MATSRPFYVASRVGLNNLLCVSKDGALRKGPFYDELDKILAQLPAGPKALFLDTLVDMFGGNENCRSDVNSFVKTVIGSLCIKHTATAILLAHPPKSADVSFSGSTAWNGAVRNRIYLKDHDNKNNTKYRVLSNEKANYGPKGGELILKWDRGIYVGVNEVEMEGLVQSAVLAAVQAGQDRNAALSLVPQNVTFYGKTKITDAEGCPLSKAVVKETLEDLLTRGIIRNISGRTRGNGLFVI